MTWLANLPRKVAPTMLSEQVVSRLAIQSHLERQSADFVLAYQQRVLAVLYRHARARSPFYASHKGILTRQDLIEAGDSLFCNMAAYHAGSTSGSTGEPVTVRRTLECQLRWLAMTMRELLWHDTRVDGVLSSCRVQVQAGEQPTWGAPADLFTPTGMAHTLPISRPLDEIAAWLDATNPDALVIMPGTLQALLNEFPMVAPRLGVIWTVGGNVPLELRERVRDTIGCVIRDAYSSEEFGSVAIQCPERGSYHVGEDYILEIVDEAGNPCKPGEVGRVILTDLVNLETPLIRYEIGDLAEAGEPCDCGRGALPTVRRFVGRERDLIRLPDGSMHWPETGMYEFAQFGIRQFRFTQHEDILVVDLYADAPHPDEAGLTKLTRLIQESVGWPFPINYRWSTEPLPGKEREFTVAA